MDTVDNQISDWLMRKYLAWQMGEGRKKTLGDFSVYLNVSRDTLNNWLGGRRKPRNESVEALATRLGPEIYDLLGMARPDAGLKFVSRLWDKLTPEQQQQIVQEVGTYANEQPKQAPDAGTPV